MTNAHEEGRVYAIDDGQGCVKIGWAKDPVRRLREMNVSDAGRLTLIGSARGTRAHEAEAHALLKPWRARGEWFRKEGHVLTFLNMLPKPSGPIKIPNPTFVDPDWPMLRRELAKRGIRLVDFARAVGIERPLATNWAQRGVPAKRVLDVERITGIPREVLRPDIFTKANTVAAKRNATSAQ